MLILEEDSCFTLYRDYSLSERDRQVLSLLYLPILKSASFSVYILLNDLSFLDSRRDYFYHVDILSQLGRTGAAFLEARSKLEGIGLLETFRKSEIGQDGKIKSRYVYHLLPPASPKKFFQDRVLKSLLISEIGQKKFFSLMNWFKAFEAPARKEEENVSCSFKDAFSTKLEGDERLLLSDNGLSDKNYKPALKADSEAIEKILQEQSYPLSQIKDNLNEIASLSSLYDVKAEDICKRIVGNTKSDGTFFRESFKKAVRNYVSYGRKEVNRNETSGKGLGADSRFIRAFRSITPKEYLTQAFNAEPSPQRLKEVEKLHESFGFDNAIINAVLDYSLRKTKKEFNQVFIDKVAFKLSGYQVSSVYEARARLKSRDFEVQRSLSQKKKEPSEESHISPSKEKVTQAEIEDLAKDIGL